MSKNLLLNNETAANVATPSSTKTKVYVDSVTKKLASKDDAGVVTAYDAASGEANTASNVGTAGVGVFKQKTGVDLEFKKINAGSTKITVTDDVANNEVDIDVAEANVVHQNLSGAGTNTHAQIDTHIADTANPHATDIGNLGAGTLAELNAAVTDATLDDSASSRPPNGSASGDLTGTYPAPTVANNAITNAKLADVATATLKGRVTAATGDPEDLTGTQATTLLDVFTSSLKGLAPSSGGGTTNFLRADGTWAAPAGGSSFPTYEFYADDFLSPVNSDWAVNALAPVAVDTNNARHHVRLFDDTTEEGVGFDAFIPSTATNIKFTFVSRAETAPAGARTVGLKLYECGSIAGAPDAWSAGTALTDIDIPTSEDFVEDSQTISLATLGLTAGKWHKFELTRVNPSAGTELVGDWALFELKVEFT